MAYTDAQYSDLLRAVNQTGSVYNYGNPQFVNPYSGAAYSPYSYREIMSRKKAPVDPRSAYTDYKPSFGERLATGSLGYQMGSQGLAPMAKGMYKGISGKEYKGDLTGLTLGSTIYGATRDQNPYEYSSAEQWGGVLGPASGGWSLGKMLAPGMKAAGPIGMALGALIGWGINVRQQKKAGDKAKEAEKQFQKERDEYRDDIAKEVKEQREQQAIGAEADLWAQQAGKYDNQYGAYTNPYGQSFFDKGGKLTEKEKTKLKKLGRNGDTELAHVNPQEKAMLKAMGGSGTINPNTGLREYGWFSDFVGDVVGAITSPFELVGDLITGEADPLGQFLDNVTFDDTRRNIFGDHTVMGHQFGDMSKTAVYDPTTGGYKIETTTPGQSLAIDPTGSKTGSAGFALGSDETGWGTTTGQTVSGTPWSPYFAPYKPGLGFRPVKGKRQKQDEVNVVNPFKSDFTGVQGDKQASTMGLENYRWDLENPYIRENVDIFDEGGMIGQPEPLPMDSMQNRQLFVESSFNPSAESHAGAIGLSQITEATFNDMIGWGWVPEGKKFNDLKTDTDLAVNLQERYMSDLMNREWNRGTDQVMQAKAIAAYNMGPTGLVNKLNELKEKGVDIYNNLDWVNELNSETKNYVNKILLGGGEKFEQEYTSAWKAGGKDYDQGGVMNPVAEFTGNELIVNDQAEVEAGIKENNAARAAAPIRLALERGLYTPGQETHKNNPMPVDDQGFIYTKGGKLPFRVRKGAGIYDHATDQFKKDMTDEQIMAVAKKNINKWEKNNMA